MNLQTTSCVGYDAWCQSAKVMLAVLLGNGTTAALALGQAKQACRDEGALRISAGRVSISAQDSQQRLLLTADAWITLHNTGKLPLSFLALRREGQFMPDADPTGPVKVFELPLSQHKPNVFCADDRKLIPLTVQGGASASVGLSVVKVVPMEDGARLARTQTMSFAGEMLVIDGAQRSSVRSLSLPDATLANGLAGSR